MFSDLFPIEWNDFHFLRPQFLWLLVPALLLPVLGLLSIKREVRWKKIIAPHLRSYVIRKGNDRAKVVMNILLFFSLSFGILALSGPTWKKVEIPGQELETPMVILLDLSQSMMATDLQPNRLERAKFKIHDLLKHNPRARAALIGFAGTAHTIVPLTKDYEIILSHIDGLKPSIMPFPGSDMEAALVLADTVMSVTEAPGTVLIFSDDFSQSQIQALQEFTSTGNRTIIIVPMNTNQGSEVPAFDGKGSLMDQNGNVVYSSLDEDVLAGLSSLENVSVQKLTLDDSDVELISAGISENLKFQTQAEEKDDDWRDAGLLLVFPMALLLLFWFRKGWVVYTLAPILLSSCAGDYNFSDLWFTRDYQGQRLMNKGQYDEAAGLFTDPMRKGVAYYKNGDYEDAIEAFKADNTAQGSYNLGLAYFHNGDTAAAMLAFGYAVEKDPTLQSARVAKDLLQTMKGGTSEVNPEDAKESQPKQTAQNEQNKDLEDLSGGGQEATKEDMEKERKEETVATDIRKGKELEDVPDDMQASSQQQDQSKVLMRKVDDDPALFLQRKFRFQVKKENIKPKPDETKW
jgi:Ca-activated chloride channel family protein